MVSWYFHFIKIFLENNCGKRYSQNFRSSTSPPPYFYRFFTEFEQLSRASEIGADLSSFINIHIPAKDTLSEQGLQSQDYVQKLNLQYTDSQRSPSFSSRRAFLSVFPSLPTKNVGCTPKISPILRKPQESTMDHEVGRDFNDLIGSIEADLTRF